jgi:alpha-ketoglutarate-dependent 2,4-dichlorophenoxyacetate dioxygenase
MTLEAKAVGPSFAAEVTGVDFSRPLDSATVAEIVAAMDRYAVCVFRGTALDDDSHIAFSRQLGRLEHAPRLFGKGFARFDKPELFDAGNLDASGNILVDERRRVYNKGNALWHTDSSFNAQRASYSLLLAHEVPPLGGDTQFADMRAAYDALPQATKDAIDPLIAEHDVFWSRGQIGFTEFPQGEREQYPPSPQRLVRRHPVTGRESLYLSAHASHITGWPVADGRLLLFDLNTHATQRAFVYSHIWRVGDLLIWDNRWTTHRGRPHDENQPRDLRRATTLDTGSTLKEVA